MNRQIDEFFVEVFWEVFFPQFGLFYGVFRVSLTAMPNLVGQPAPLLDVQFDALLADGTIGKICLRDFLNQKKYIVLFSYPLDLDLPQKTGNGGSDMS